MIMHMLLSQSQGDASQPAILQILQDQQVAYTVQLADATRQLREAESQYDRAVGAQREAAGSRLSALEARVATTQQRLNDVHERMALVQRDIAISTMGNHAAPGVAVAPPREGMFGFTVAEFGGGLTLLFAFPIVLGLSRWIWRRTAPSAVPANVLEGNPQFARLEQAVEAIAIEVERISEAQRFSAKLLSERPVEAIGEPSPRRVKRPVITPLP